MQRHKDWIKENVDRKAAEAERERVRLEQEAAATRRRLEATLDAGVRAAQDNKDLQALEECIAQVLTRVERGTDGCNA